MNEEDKMAQQENIKISLSQAIYEKLFNPILSRDEGIDAEKLTNFSLGVLSKVSLFRELPGISTGLHYLKSELQRIDPRLEQKLFGCHFKNPVGLAAGFDKNGVASAIWDHFGFGFAEIGTVTWHSQKGNPKPRLFRLAKEEAALNRMGFNNNGAQKMLQTLQNQKIKIPGKRQAILGINLGKSKKTTLEKAPDDYLASLEKLAPFADYVVINVSSPNTPGLRQLQDANRLQSLICNLKKLPSCPPLLVKIAPDLNNQEIEELSALAQIEKLAGIIAVNTSINRLGLEQRIIAQSGLSLAEESGGLSGSPLRHRSLEVIRHLYQCSENLPIIGVGGINSPKTAWEKITAGASLIQVYTGWIYKGPSLVPRIIEGLSTQIDRHGFKNITEAIGSEAPWI
tara:strand:- start:68106 stop:69299 length:1194 start_codon:yes stop_codon:yes gene_type:complete